jgi:hypothetical protein
VPHPERGGDRAERGEDEKNDRHVRPDLQVVRASVHVCYISVAGKFILFNTSQGPCRRGRAPGREP